MLKLLKWGSLLLSVGSLLLAGVFLLSPKQGSLQQEPATALPEKQETKVEKPQIVERKGDRIIWRLQAESARQEETVMHMIQPLLELFAENGQVVPVRADEAWFDPVQRNIRFAGKVEVLYQQWKLETASLQYESGRDVMLVPGEFKLNGEQVRMRGGTMEVERLSQRLYVKKHVWVEDARSNGLGSLW